MKKSEKTRKRDTRTHAKLTIQPGSIEMQMASGDDDKEDEYDPPQ